VGTVNLNTMLRECNSGDIILFDNPIPATYVIKYATNSNWDHVGMILKYDPHKPQETIMIESMSCGVFICYAEERLRQVLDDSNPTKIGWRKLSGPNNQAAWKKNLHQFAESLIDTPYEQNFSEFVKAWIGEDQWAKAVLSMAGGALAEGATKGEDLNSLFCSELCAALYKHARVMDPRVERDSNAYSPKDFSSQSNASLTLQHPWELKTELQVVTYGQAEEMPISTGVKGGATPNESGKTLNIMVSDKTKAEAAAEAVLGMQRILAEALVEKSKKDLAEAPDSEEAKLALAAAEKTLNDLPAPPAAKVDLPSEHDKQKGGCCF